LTGVIPPGGVGGYNSAPFGKKEVEVTEAMDRETMLKEFPKLMARVEEDIDELRYLLVIDPNEYDPEIDDEFDIFDPEDYNYLVYLTERLQNAMGEELKKALPEILEKEGVFENFLVSEEDLYGIRADMDEVELARKMLSTIESKLA
jgi:hypothetical protein